uniref:Sec-independent protein translocase component TatC n=1 Tax=Histiona aroides TaxID=392300 RepID=M4Q9H3_HISAR|nr:Sec-independent protein translocase component TatC [Histiona aroides]AGH24067.1 Sec-independent protein translocase component TatC [Histiona aroides]
MVDIKNIPVLEYVNELRYRVLYYIYGVVISAIACYIYKEEILYILSIPFGQRFIYTDLIEAFTVYIKMSILVSLYVSYPIAVFHIWSFLVPGLYLYEKKRLRLYTIVSNMLYFIAGITGHYILFPAAFQFFQSFQKVGLDKVFNIELQAKIQEYVLFNVKMIYALSLCFQLPVILLIIWMINEQLYRWIVNKRRFIYVLSFIIAACISPPDVLSQLIIATPLIALFEASVFIIVLIGNYNK